MRLAWPLMPVVLRTALCLARHRQEAEDLAQETMLKASRSIDSFEDGTNAKAWLLTILRRTHIDRGRVTSRRPLNLSLDESMLTLVSDEEQDADLDASLWKDPEELMERFEDEAVAHALRSLPDDLRWTLLLVDVEGLDQAAAAETLGVAVGTIKSRTHRGRAVLRGRLQRLAEQRGWIDPKGVSA